MKYKNILITGGAGFVGSNLAIKLKEHYTNVNIFVLDNLKRRGSELNIPRLKEKDIIFIHGDIRNKEDFIFEGVDKMNLILECSAEPSVLAGVYSSPEYLINTNLVGAINCLELARQNKADFIFLSTSRVYPIEALNKLEFQETETRFILNKEQKMQGASEKGIAENFPLDKARSLYGATKLAAEFFLQEYISTYRLKGVINRCGLITGPWQMGKVDQGVISLWIANHIFKKKLAYIGYGGEGKQVRDFLHIDDLFNLINIQIKNLNKFDGQIYNVGGGVKNSISLCELTSYCQKYTKSKINIESVNKNRPNDIRIYISDCSKIFQKTGWRPRKKIDQTVLEITKWINDNKDKLENILA
ncbi:MAG: CDP-paratose 2-epimerase [Candidatus Berkelbacteria bacterium Licking1014_85]|uniref:CDP-paratose 2-epimerase n=1 Tax=Candidatus Berkelbacteria bacterium Licking1014_85 TaxID=2017148 RepID=A0A554LFR0_9BACT|nr:MAG: CDP-paratose 2-epimerase [Candidatus Berkelbacteria bacterium Licking1014_85]